MLKDLVVRTRSYRRFRQDFKISRQELEELVDLARMTASAGSRQPLKYYLSCDPQMNSLILPNLVWAGYLLEKGWPGPSEGERPSAYIVMLCDTEILRKVHGDDGISAQTILLGATEKGLGGGIIVAIYKDNLREALKIQPRFEIELVIALGKPRETVVIDPVQPGGDIKYWRDSEDRHHVPKRSLQAKKKLRFHFGETFRPEVEKKNWH